MTTSWALEMDHSQGQEVPLRVLLDTVVARLGEGAATADEVPVLDELARAVREGAGPDVIEGRLRELSRVGYLRGTLCTLASAVRHRDPGDVADVVLVIARELIDALAPDLGVGLARALLSLPEVEATRLQRGGPYTSANLLTGEALLEGGDAHGALRHFEAILAFDVDHSRALQGWSAAVQALQRRGITVEQHSRGLALLDGLEELELAGGMGVDRYELGRPLGRGRHAVVYQAHDRRVGREVAIKRLLDRSARSDGIPERILASRFFTEARTLARVRSPFVVALLDVQPEHRFIALELCRGGNLRRAMRRRQLDGRALPSIARQLQAAVRAVHAVGAVHRDIKPANILVREWGPRPSIALADFGLAIHAQPRGPGPHAGTLRYLAPELRTGGAHATAASDLFSAGVVLLELASLPDPLPEDFDRVDGDLEATRHIPPDLPETEARMLHGLLQADPEARRW